MENLLANEQTKETTYRNSGKRLDIYLIISMLLAAFLNIYLIWTDKYVNTYYTTAVASMMKSFHNFFYGTLDSGGFVTVDKPPLTFMIQTLFAFVFGLHGWVVILPQALAGVGSVLLIYLLVKPTFGAGAARIGALAMACTPVAVSVSRTNNIDSMLVFALLVAVWFLFKGVKTGKAWYIIIGFGLIGVGFNIKMLEAYMVLPAFYFFYILAGKGSWKKKLSTLIASTVVCAVISLSWAVIVDSVPKDQRPYIGSSQTNSVLNLAFGYNGLSRLTGDRSTGGGNPAGGGMGFGDMMGGGMNFEFPQNGETGQNGQQGELQNQDGRQSGFQGSTDRSGGRNQQGRFAGRTGSDGNYAASTNGNEAGGSAGNDSSSGQSSGQFGGGTGRGGGRGGFGANGMFDNPDFGGDRPAMNFGGGGGMFGTGQKGPLRLFQSELSGQASWLLPFILLGCISLLVSFRSRNFTWKHKETLFWLAWLIPVMGFFSMAGFFHPYYLIMLAPPIAALAGSGWSEMAMQWRNSDGWKAWLLPVAVLAATAFSWYIVHPFDKEIGRGWSIAIAASGILAVLWLVAGKFKLSMAKPAAVIGILILMIGPMYWSVTPIIYGQSSQTPQAGPTSTGFGRGGGFSGGGGGGNREAGLSIDNNLYQYLKDNNTGEQYLFAATDYSTLAPYIIEKGEDVISLGGFSGSDPVMTVDRLKGLIADGKLKYIYFSGGGRGGSSSLDDWIKQNGKEIPSTAWQGETGQNQTSGDSQGNSRASFGNFGGFGGGTLYEFTPDQGE